MSVDTATWEQVREDIQCIRALVHQELIDDILTQDEDIVASGLVTTAW